MGDDRLMRLRLCADFEAHHQGRLQFLEALEAMGQGGEPVGGDHCFGSFEALSEHLRRMDWLPRFGPDMPARFKGSSDPVEFL
jgi:hypothetical protein